MSEYKIEHLFTPERGYSATVYDFTEGMNIAIGNFKELLAKIQSLESALADVRAKNAELKKKLKGYEIKLHAIADGEVAGFDIHWASEMASEALKQVEEEIKKIGGRG